MTMTKKLAALLAILVTSAFAQPVVTPPVYVVPSSSCSGPSSIVVAPSSGSTISGTAVTFTVMGFYVIGASFK